MLTILITLMVIGTVVFGGSMPFIFITEKPIFGIIMMSGGALTFVSMIIAIIVK